jgi:hypothetical protein
MKKAFQVLQFEPVPDKPHLVRLVGAPYKPTDPNCPHLTVPVNKETRIVSPLVIKRVLAKFQIQDLNFIQALNDSKLETMESLVKRRPTGTEGSKGRGDHES